MIPRHLSALIEAKLADNKAVILFGLRQVGKSTLLTQLSPKFKPPVLWMNGDDTDVRTLLESPTSPRLKSVIENARTWVIDEAQRIKNIGLLISTWKVLQD